jgi:prepilin signal peptidase PulO-like enzyme (type II secretory pathway)
MENVLFGLWLFMVALLLILIIIDLHWYLLPDQFVWPLVLLALVFASVRTVIDDPEVVLNHAFYGALACWGVFYALFRVSQGRWIGGGDVKLAIFIGLLLGPQQGLLALLLSFYLATAVILPGLLLKRLSRKDPIPFGPFLIASVIIMQLFGPDLTDWLRTFLSLS